MTLATTREELGRIIAEAMSDRPSVSVHHYVPSLIASPCVVVTDADPYVGRDANVLTVRHAVTIVTEFASPEAATRDLDEMLTLALRAIRATPWPCRIQAVSGFAGLKTQSGTFLSCEITTETLLTI